MKNIYKLGIATLFSLMGLTVSALGLPKIGIEGGVNLSNSSWNVGSLDKKARSGFQVGLTADIPIFAGWHLQSGLSYTTKGAIVEGTTVLEDASIVNGKITVNQSYLQVPIYAAYKIRIVPGTRIVFNAGPYFAQGVGGRTRVSGSVPRFDMISVGQSRVDTFGEDGFLKRFDFGLGGGVGVEFLGFVGTIRYELGLVNLSQHNSFNYKNRNASFTLGYKF